MGRLWKTVAKGCVGVRFGTSPQNAPPPAKNSPGPHPVTDIPIDPVPIEMRQVVENVLQARDPFALTPTTA